MNYSAQLAHDVSGIVEDGLGERDEDVVCRLIFDYLGCVRGAVDLPWVRNVRAWAATYAGAGPSAISDSNLRVPPAVAAMVNATAAHGFELDDTHDASLSHPGSVVISAALAAADEVRVDGKRFLSAIAAGYEAMGRIGMAADAGKVIAHGHHPTALFGAFGAATTVSLLRGDSRRQLLESWGHALSLASGAMQFADEDEGTDVKRVHAGHAAHGGVLAAELVTAGISAPLRPIDGRYGVLAVFGHDPRPEMLEVDRDHLIVRDISLKPYACCRQFHSAIDAIIELLASGEVDLVAVSAVRVRGPKVLGEQHGMRRPTSPMAAQYSLPFVVGAVLELGAERFDAFDEHYLGHRGILRWADMVEIEVDEELERQYPQHFGAEVEIDFGESRRTVRVLDGLGTSARPFSYGDIREKAELLTQNRREPVDFAALQGTVAALPQTADVAALSLV